MAVFMLDKSPFFPAESIISTEISKTEDEDA